MGIAEIARMLEDGARIPSGRGSVTLRTQSAGDLVVTSGRIVACDPFVCPETPPFSRRVPAGKWPVILYVADYGSDQRVACARVRVGSSPPARWEGAWLEGHPPGKDGDTTWYGVDAGTGGFMDAEAAAVLAGDPAAERLSEDIASRMEETYVHTWSWANYPVVPSTGANLVAFSSGIGDGSYPTWWELDAQGEIVGLITDFGLLEDATRASGGGKRWWQFWK